MPNNKLQYILTKFPTSRLVFLYIKWITSILESRMRAVKKRASGALKLGASPSANDCFCQDPPIGVYGSNGNNVPDPVIPTYRRRGECTTASDELIWVREWPQCSRAAPLTVSTLNGLNISVFPHDQKESCHGSI
jgi:hypothetical protein